jgi:RHS repeat-associated protein
MPGEGFFYTYLTNFSDNLVTFDNLTIRHKQGTLRNIHEYYPYGLEYWHTNNKLYDRGDQYSEFHHREWEMDGIEMNRFAARWYDPTIARWHAPDPLEQMHSPYVALCGDPANYVDPDGRAGIHLSDWDKKYFGFAGVIAGGAAMVGIGQALQGASGISQGFSNLSKLSQTFETVRDALSFASSIFSGAVLMNNISGMTDRFGVGGEIAMAKSEAVSGQIAHQGNSGGKLGTSVSNDLRNELFQHDSKKSGGDWPGLINLFRSHDIRPKIHRTADLGWYVLNVNTTLSSGGELRIAESDISKLLPLNDMSGDDWQITGVRVDGMDSGDGIAGVFLNGDHVSIPVGFSGFQNIPPPFIRTTWTAGINNFFIQCSFIPFLNWRPFIFTVFSPIYMNMRWGTSSNFPGSNVGLFTNARSLSIKYWSLNNNSSNITQVQVRIKGELYYDHPIQYNGDHRILRKSSFRKFIDFILYGN